MKQKLYTLFFTLIISVGTICASDISINGIWYALDNSTKTASVTYHGTYAFEYSDEYSGEVIIPSSVTYDGITYSVTSIGYFAFSQCEQLASVTIPNSITSIGEEAFSGCSNLTCITIPNSVISIGDNAFYGCKGLTSVTIPKSVTSIGKYTFGFCTALTSITIPNSVTNIGKYAFHYCTSLKDVNIPNSVKAIGESAFKECGLTSVTIGNSVTSIGKGAFWECYNLRSVAIPNGITSIEEETFSGCHNLTSVTIPNSVTSIGGHAFYYCTNLSSVTIPNSVTSIGNGAFYNCYSIKAIYALPIVPPSVYDNTFTGINQNIIVYVPFACSSTYKAANYWKNLAIQGPTIIQDIQKSSTTCVLTFNVEGTYIVSCGIEGGESFVGNTLEYNGLEPNSEYKDIPVVLTSNNGLSETIKVSFTTSALELKTQPSKAVSSNTAILLAQTNMADIETSCGFEYKRNDAPEDFAPTKVFCPVASGQMAGRLKGLKDDVYYKYRAFYQSSAGNMYYGDWQYIFTGDVTVEFDPILYTYAATIVHENDATITGYALAGAEDFTEQGFEYWADSRVANNAPVRVHADLGEHFFVQASGIRMSVTLTNLDAGTNYKYRAYGKVGNQYYYGSEQSFTTQGEYVSPEAIEIASIEAPRATKILRDGQILIQKGNNTYTITGQKIK